MGEEVTSGRPLRPGDVVATQASGFVVVETVEPSEEPGILPPQAKVRRLQPDEADADQA